MPGPCYLDCPPWVPPKPPKPSLTPWRWDAEDRMIWSADDRSIVCGGIYPDSTYPPDTDDANHIVKCVNLHEELVSAVSMFALAMDSLMQGRLPMTRAMIDALLAKAKGEA